MGISLKSIELANIRSHKHFKFSPADHGVTAISGPTGSGKSTLVDSFAWTLFGTKPKGVSKNSAILREGTDIKQDKVYARVELEVDGVLVKIERRMVSKTGGTECDIWEWNEDGSKWDRKAGSATTHAEVYIRQRLKMDEQGFLTAVLVQQKQVDKLISAGAPERAKIIEKLTGIASISAGLAAASKEHRGLKKAIELTTVDESQLEEVEKELDESEQKLNVAKDDYRIAKEKLQVVHGELKDFESDVEEKTKSFELAERARKALGEYEVKLEATEGLLEDAKTERDDAKAQLPQGSRGISYEESLSKLKKLKSSVASLESSKLYHERIIRDSSAQLRELEALIGDSGYKSAEKVQKVVKATQKDIDGIAKDLKKISNESSELRGETAQLESAIEVVSHGENCPTCRQSVADVSGAVKALEAQRGLLQSKIDELEVREEMLTSEREEQRSQLRGFESLVESFSELDEVRSTIEESEKELSENASELKAKATELKAAEKLHKIVEREEENSKRYDAALARLQKIVKAIEDLKGRRKKAKAVLDESSAPSESKLNSLRNKLYKIQVSYQDDRVALGELKSDAKVLSNSIAHLRDKRELYKKEVERHRELLRSVEISGATVETLTEFRTNRVKTALPTIESYASELLSRFTDGKFVALKLDEKFNASVLLASGVERPVGLLSGGELSAASIALRLSVSMMLNASDSSNLIILDEVLVSQDADRSELILTTIRDVCKGQVVMISHGAGVSAIADKKVDLTGS